MFFLITPDFEILQTLSLVLESASQFGWDILVGGFFCIEELHAARAGLGFFG